MNIRMTVTQENTKSYPLHRHDVLELMCYIKGHGILHTKKRDYKFEEGTIIAIPAETIHGSRSEDGFVNICAHFNASVADNDILYIKSGSPQQIRLFEILRDLYFSDSNFDNIIVLLVLALKELIYMPDMKTNGNLDSKIHDIYEKIVTGFLNDDFNLSAQIAETGYTNDYFREKFRQKYGITPRTHLESLRMEYAMSLIKTYGNKLEIAKIAEMCGYTDSLYFSKKFKNLYGYSPGKFRKPM